MTENYLAAVATDSFPFFFSYYGEPITSVRIIDSEGLASGSVVTFDDPNQSRDASITVEVRHLYELVIPLVNRMVFWVYTRIQENGRYGEEPLNYISDQVDRERREGGDFYDIEYRIPIVAHYTIHLQSDYVVQ